MLARHVYIRKACVAFTLAMAVAMAVAISLAACAQDAGGTRYTIQKNVDEVRLEFSASDHRGHAITQLSPGSVAVVDNGEVIRKFRSFRSTAKSPVNLVILLDASDSVAKWIPRMIEDVKRFVSGAAWQPEDRIAMVAFGGMQPVLICAQNCNEAEAGQNLSALRAGGSTPLYDALVFGSGILEADPIPQVRNAMIVFSDGYDTSSLHTLDDAIEKAQQAGAQIYTVDSGDATSAAEGASVLSRLAQDSGGLCFARNEDADAALESALLDLRAGFVLTYDLPQRTPGLHWVRVLPATDPDLRLRSRQAYRDDRDQRSNVMEPETSILPHQ